MSQTAEYMVLRAASFPSRDVGGHRHLPTVVKIQQVWININIFIRKLRNSRCINPVRQILCKGNQGRLSHTSWTDIHISYMGASTHPPKCESWININLTTQTSEGIFWFQKLSTLTKWVYLWKLLAILPQSETGMTRNIYFFPSGKRILLRLKLHSR